MLVYCSLVFSFQLILKAYDCQISQQDVPYNVLYRILNMIQVHATLLFLIA